MYLIGDDPVCLILNHYLPIHMNYDIMHMININNRFLVFGKLVIGILSER